jgi:hypothetical protein
MNRRDFATKMLANTEQLLAAAQAAEATYRQELKALADEEPVLLEIHGRELLRDSGWEGRLRMRQCADELQAALDAGATDAVLTARLDALLEASSQYMDNGLAEELRARLRGAP